MTRAQVLKAARAQFGEYAVVEYQPRAPLRGQAREASAALKEHREQKPVMPALQGRGDTTYGDRVLDYREAYAAWRETEQRLQSIALHGGRCRVLVRRGLGSQILGQADSWDEAWEEAKGRKAFI